MAQDGGVTVDEWHSQYWAGQPEPRPGTREHLEKYGGPDWRIVAAVLVAAVGGLLCLLMVV